MFYAGIKGFYWTHVSAFLNIFNQFWCWYNTALFDTVTLLIFLVFYWRYKKNNWLWFHIANKKLWSKKFTLHEATSCLSSQNLTCPTPLQFVARKDIKGLLPFCTKLLRYITCICTIKITATFLFVPLLLNHQSAIFLVRYLNQ